MIFDNLKSYFEFGREENLRKARYWYEKWVSHHPLERRVTTDGYEGTAKYVETLANLIDIQGCAASEAELKKAAIEHIKSSYGSSVSGWHFALDSEGYEIGGLAALILRFGSYDLKEWNSRMEKGETPLEVLLENVTSLEEPEPRELRDTFRVHAKSQNKWYGTLIGKDISNWSDRTYVRVSFPSQLFHSTYSPIFFARSVELDKMLMPLAMELHLFSPSGLSDFHLRPNAVVFLSDSSNICPNNYGYTLVPRTELHFASGREATVKTPSIVGKLVGEMKTDESGFEYFCAE